MPASKRAALGAAVGCRTSAASDSASLVTGAAVRAARQRRQNRLRAARLPAPGSPAGTRRSARRLGVSPGALRVVRADDRDAGDARHRPARAAVVARDARILERLARLLDEQARFLDERDADLARPGRQRRRAPSACLPGRTSTSRGRPRPASVNSCTCSPSTVTSSCCGSRMLPAPATSTLISYSPSSGNRCRTMRAAARAERQPLDVIVLLRVGRDPIDLVIDRRQRRADGEPADRLGGREIALHQRRREPQHAGDVVEAVARVVGRQEIRDVRCRARADR